MQKLEPGQFVTFTYNPPARDIRVRNGLQTVADRELHDRDKYVLILNPNWQMKVHAVDLKRLTPAEVDTLKAIFDPNVKKSVEAGEWPIKDCPPYPLIRDILRRMDPLTVVKNPVLAYQTLIKPFLRNKDAYRIYWQTYMYGPKVVVESHVTGQVRNPRPMFGKPLFKKI